jgi:uncharacterized protein (DUF302 family)
MTEDRMAAEAAVVTKLSPGSVHDTAAKLTAMISAKGMKLFAVIDQAAEARQVGLTLRETKVLIWADEGQTKVSYYALAASRHLTADLVVNLVGINALTDALVAP